MYYFLIILFAVLFYLIIPGTGIYFLNRRQQKFIERTSKSRFYPLFPDHFIHDDTFETPQDGTFIRFFGKIASWDTSSLMILKNQGLQVKVQLRQGRIMILVPAPDKKKLAAYSLKTLDLQNIGAVNLHTNVFVCGLIQKTEMPNRQEMLTFIESDKNPLTIVLFEGDNRQFFSRLMMAAAHFHIDSSIIVPSLMAGFFFLLLIFTALVQTSVPNSYTLTAAVSLLSLFALILPPGVISAIPVTAFLGRSTDAHRFKVYLQTLLYGLNPADSSRQQPDTQQNTEQQVAEPQITQLQNAEQQPQTNIMQNISAVAAMPSGEQYVLAAYNKDTISTPPMELPPEISPGGTSTWTVFGVQHGTVIEESEDPFFPHAVIPYTPQHLLDQIEQKSNRWRLLALTFAALGLTANLYILAQFLRWLM